MLRWRRQQYYLLDKLKNRVLKREEKKICLEFVSNALTKPSHSTLEALKKLFIPNESETRLFKMKPSIAKTMLFC